MSDRLEEFRQDVRDREEAHRRADDFVVRVIRAATADIEAMNFGTAKDRLEALLNVLPHDHGAQTFTPLFNVKLDQVRGVEPDVVDELAVDVAGDLP